MSDNDALKQAFLEAPAGELDPILKPIIERWDDPDPTAIQVLEVLDKAVHGSLASGFAVQALAALYDGLLKEEGKTHEEVVALVTWRPTDGS